MKDVFAVELLVMVLFIGIENDFVGVVDLFICKVWVWDDFGDLIKYEIKDVLENMIDDVEKYWEMLVEIVIE